MCAPICNTTQYYNNYNLYYYRETRRHQQVCACLHLAACCSSAAARARLHIHTWYNFDNLLHAALYVFFFGFGCFPRPSNYNNTNILPQYE